MHTSSWTLKTAREYYPPLISFTAARSAQQSTALAPRNPPSLAIQQTTDTPRSRHVSSIQQSVLATPRSSHVGTSLTPINNRGSDRVHKIIPWQTLHNRKKLKLNSGVAKESNENSHHLPKQGTVEQNDECLDNDYGHSYHIDTPIPNSDLSSERVEVIQDDEPQKTSVPWLFPPSWY